MSFLELDDPIEVETPLGRGSAIFIEATAHEQYWTVILNETLAIVTFKQKKIKAVRNYTAGSGIADAEMMRIIRRGSGKSPR